MILLVLVALLWIAVLAPGLITKISERRSTGSIESFHDRLHLLERTGPKLIVPANRLESAAPRRLPTAVGYGQPPLLRPAARPALVLLGTAQTASQSSADDVAAGNQPGPPGRVVASQASIRRAEFDEAEFPAVRMLDGPSLAAIARHEPTDAPDVALWQPPVRTAPAERRALAARRRRDVLGILITVMVLSGLLAIVPSLRRALIATAVAAFLTVVFVAMAIYAVSVRAARQRAIDLALGPPATEGFSAPEVSHVGPLHRLGQEPPGEGDDEPELRRVVRAS